MRTKLQHFMRLDGWNPAVLALAAHAAACGVPVCAAEHATSFDAPSVWGSRAFVDLDGDGAQDWLFAAAVAEDADELALDGDFPRYGLAWRRARPDLPERFDPTELLWVLEYEVLGEATSSPVESRSADVDGDGRLELLTRFWSSGGSEGSQIVEGANEWRIHRWSDGRLTHLGPIEGHFQSMYDVFDDFDGDGTIDLLNCDIVGSEGTYLLFPGPLAGAVSSQPTGVPCFENGVPKNFHVADFDGDHSADIGIEDDRGSSRVVRLRSGAQELVLADGPWFADEELLDADFDGQPGRDTLGIADGQVFLRFNTGGRFEVHTFDEDDVPERLVDVLKERHRRRLGGVADLDGDGRDEVFRLDPEEGLFVFRVRTPSASTGSSFDDFFTEELLPPPDPHGFTNVRVALGDSDGDDATELHQPLRCQGAEGQSWLHTFDL